MSSTGPEDRPDTPNGSSGDTTPDPGTTAADAAGPGSTEPGSGQQTSRVAAAQESTAAVAGSGSTGSSSSGRPDPSDQTETTSLPRTGRDDSADRTDTTALPRTGPAQESSSGPSSQPGRPGRTSRSGDTEPTTQMPRTEAPQPAKSSESASAADRDREAAGERAAARAERQRALGVRSQPTPSEEPVEVGPTKHSTDRFLGSLGLFLIRLIVAVIMGVHGAQKLLDLEGTTQFFATTALPYPEIFALVTAVGEVLIALALLLGLLVRVAGVGVLAISVGALVLVYWYQWPFQEGTSGFQGELELLLAGAGLLFLCVGGGWWGIDAAMRRGRARRRAGV